MKKKYLIDDFEARSVALIAGSLLVPRARRAATVSPAKPKPRRIAPLLLGYAAARAGIQPVRRDLALAF